MSSRLEIVTVFVVANYRISTTKQAEHLKKCAFIGTTGSKSVGYNQQVTTEILVDRHLIRIEFQSPPF